MASGSDDSKDSKDWKKLQFGLQLEFSLIENSDPTDKKSGRIQKALSVDTDKRSNDLYNSRFNELSQENDDDDGTPPIAQHLRTYGFINDDDKSKQFLEQNQELINQESYNSLVDFAVDKEMNDEYACMELFIRQALIIKSIIKYTETTISSRMRCIAIFFDRMTYDQKYNKKFIKDLAALRDLVEETARHENEKLLKKDLSKLHEEQADYGCKSDLSKLNTKADYEDSEDKPGEKKNRPKIQVKSKKT